MDFQVMGMYSSSDYTGAVTAASGVEKEDITN
jgi:hypothetical protein